MELAVGSVVAGKVTGITKFGAFIGLGPGKSGLVHISEIADTYVNDVNEFLAVGQEVKVKIVNVDDNGRMNLSIKAANPKPERTENRDGSAKRPARPYTPRPNNQSSANSNFVKKAPADAAPKAAVEPSFEDKLRRFMQDSDSKMSGLQQFKDQRGHRRGR